MSEYPKIETVYDRNPEDKKHVIMGQLRLPEFGLIDKWLITEKIDGTNVRIFWENGKVRFGGRTDAAQMPLKLLDALTELFPPEKMARAFIDPDATVILYGEGYGAGIQKGGDYRKNPSFRLFDVKIGSWWLNWPNVEDVAEGLGIKTVPVLAQGLHQEQGVTIKEALNFLRSRSTVAIEEGEWKEGGQRQQEGIVARTDPLLFTRSGKRLMWKLKVRDLNV